MLNPVGGGLPAMRFPKRHISDWTDAIAGKPPPTVQFLVIVPTLRVTFESGRRAS